MKNKVGAELFCFK